MNPLLARPEVLIALDAHILFHPPEAGQADLPKLAVRAYPSQDMTDRLSHEGTPVIIRPIRPEDERIMVKFHHTLSEKSVYYRYFQMMPVKRRIAHERLSRICFIDYERELALVVERKNPESGELEILGVGRLVKSPGVAEVEFAVIVSDAWQGQGLGSKLLAELIAVARQEKIERLAGTILPENYGMLHVCKKLGFGMQRSIADRIVKAVMDLAGS